MRYFITSDIHSYYTIWKNVLNNAGFDISNNEHILVVLGDLFDRGEEHQQIIDFILSLPEERTLLVTGNHEELLDALVERGYPLQHDISNGTYATLMELCKLPYCSFETEQVKQLLEQTDYYKLRSRMKDYVEIDNYIFVHGWIPCDESTYMFDSNWKQGDWKSARWLNGMKAWKQGCSIPDKTIICGHWHCSYGWSHIRQEREEFPEKNNKNFLKSFEPFIDKGIVAIDACTAYTNHINVYIIEVK